MNFSLNTYLEELAPLVNVDCGTYTLEGNKVVVELMEKKYQDLDWSIKRIDCGKAGIGLEARNKPESEQIDIMLVGHLDTVFPVGTVAERPMTYDAEKAYGPGVSDMKSGQLNIVYAMRHLSPEVLDKLSIAICMNPDEETGSLDSVDWIQATAKQSKCVLVAEAARANGALVKARKGMARYNLSFNGVAAHSGNEPENGRSAITEMANWILAMNKLTNLETGTTLNVGVVSGGAGANIVPAQASAIVDVRFWDNDEYDAINNTLAEMVKHTFDADVSVDLVREAYKPSMLPSETTQSLMALVESAGEEVGVDVTWVEAGGGSDANNTAILGIPTLDGLGPIGGGFHSVDEFLVLDSVEPRIKLLMRLVEKLAA